MVDLKLSPHFLLSEFSISQTAVRRGWDNTPPEQAIENIKRLAQTLELVRRCCASLPLVISSGYRFQALNQAMGGAPSSAHCLGLAADFTVPAFGPPAVVFNVIRDVGVIAFDQLIIEGGSWVHLAIAPLGVTPRQQALEASFVNGKAHYQLLEGSA